MPTIRDLVGALRQRDGVDAALVLGRDGLLIDSLCAPDVDPERVAALIPAIVAAADEYAAHDDRGALTTAVLEFHRGIAIASVLSRDVILLVLTRPTADLGTLLFELRRHRESIAALV
jgi:predicted regulator of Ras-like GTPase activity (Roadblock/LC7/MglB family)